MNPLRTTFAIGKLLNGIQIISKAGTFQFLDLLDPERRQTITKSIPNHSQLFIRPNIQMWKFDTVWLIFVKKRQLVKGGHESRGFL